MRRLLTILLLGMLTVSTVRAQQDAGTANEMADDVLRRRGYQVELPRGGEEEGEYTSEGMDRRIRQRPKRGRQYRRRRNQGDGGGSFFGGGDSTLLYILLVVALAVLIWAIWSSARTKDANVRVVRKEPTERRARPRPQWRDDPLHDASALAAEGKFAEAVHVLLLASFDGLHRYREIRFGESLTSREIVVAAELEPGQTQALRGIVEAVERTLFGGQDAGRTEYELCVAHYESLLERTGGAS